MNGVPNKTDCCYAECKPKWRWHPTDPCCYNLANCYPTLIYVPPSSIVVDGRKVELSRGWRMRPSNSE